jgi:hypothetical protein
LTKENVDALRVWVYVDDDGIWPYAIVDDARISRNLVGKSSRMISQRYADDVIGLEGRQEMYTSPDTLVFGF